MRMKKGLRKLVSAGLVLAMTLGLTACGGGKTVSADPALAKQYVYSYEDIELPDMGDDVSVRDVARYNDRIYLIVEVYHWDEASQENDIRLMSMNADGTDVQTVEMEFPKTEKPVDDGTSEDGVSEEGTDSDTTTEEPIGEAVPYDMDDMARTTDVAVEEVVEEETENKIVAEVDIMDDMALNEEYYSQTYEYTGFNHYVISSTGNIYAVKEYYFEDYSDPENYISKRENAICAWDLNGKLLWQSAPIENLETDESYSYISKLIPAENGMTILISGDNVSKIEMDAEGNMSERKELPNGNEILYSAGEILVKEDGTLLIPHYNDDWTSMFLTAYDIKTDTVGEETKLPDSFMWSGYNALTAGVTTDIVYSNSNGLFGYSVGDEQPTQLMSFINSDLNTNNMHQIVMLDETHFIGFYYDSINYENMGAIFTKKNPEDIPDKEVIVVGGVYIGYDLKTRIIDFNRENQEYRIVVKSYDSYNTMEDYNAGNTQLNNDIISGNMPDILIADNTLPMESYISKGLIADVGKLIEEDEELSQVEFMENVFNAYKVDDKLYYVIPSFYMTTFIGKTSMLGDRTGWNMQEFQEFVDSLPEGTNVLGELTRDGFMYQMMQYSGSDFVDVSTGKCNFDSQEFISMLEFAKSLPAELSEDYYGEDYWMNYESQYREDRTVLMNMYISSFRDMNYQLNGYFGEDVTFIGFPATEGNGAVLMANDSMYALSAKSKNLDGAWDFVRYYLTDEYQNKMDWGLPVAKQAFMDKTQEATQRPYYLDENGEKVEYDNYFTINGESVVLEPLTQEQVDQVVEVVMATEKLSYYNQDIQNIINEEVAAFFEGQKSAAEVAQIIQSRAQIFVDENR